MEILVLLSKSESGRGIVTNVCKGCKSTVCVCLYICKCIRDMKNLHKWGYEITRFIQVWIPMQLHFIRNSLKNGSPLKKNGTFKTCPEEVRGKNRRRDPVQFFSFSSAGVQAQKGRRDTNSSGFCKCFERAIVVHKRGCFPTSSFNETKSPSKVKVYVGRRA